MIATEDNIHGGHRDRMRAKFRTYGERVFETYELLEMLLYYIIPYKDTNPVAKELLLRFSKLTELSATTREQLLEVNGVGERTADFLLRINQLSRRVYCDGTLNRVSELLTHDAAGEFFVNYFSSFPTKEERNMHRTVMALLDSSMRLIAMVEPYKLDFSSGAVRSRPFIEAALAAHASVVILAHNHPYGPTMPTAADIETNKMVRDDLMAADIMLAEHFIVSGNEYVSTMHVGRYKLSQSSLVNSFVKDCERYTMPCQRRSMSLGNGKKELLYEILSVTESPEDADRLSSVLASTFVRVADVFGADFYVLEQWLPERAACFIKLISALYMRSRTEAFGFGCKHTKDQIGKYLTDLIGNEAVEYVYVIVLDKKGNTLACDFVTEGSVCASTLTPRRLLEVTKRYAANSVMLAHNHPGGEAVPSSDDISATITLAKLFESVGIKLTSHFVVAKNDYFVIDGEAESKRGL